MLNRSLEPPLDIHPRPFAIAVLAHSTHQQNMVDAVEKGPNIKINNPVMSPATLPGDAHRING